MKISTLNKILFSLILFSQFCFAQVDVVYNDLVWSDEFDANGAINANNWFQQAQLPGGGGWYNGEVQHYTSKSDNAFVAGGYLNIVAKKENYTDQGVTKAYTSARLNSKFAYKYGRVDIKAKVPVEAGSWPAIWMLGKNVNEPGAYFSSNYGTTSWPACGEIDIMEHGLFGDKSINYVQSTLHTPSSSGNSANFGGLEASDLANNYHVYSMNWSPNQLSFLLDNVVYYTYAPEVKDASTWPFDKEQFLLLNIAMGGTAGAISPNFTQSTMLIDYVRVYQNTTIDSQPPSNFTASVGLITGSSVELLLNATDNSGTVAYSVNYGTGNSSTSYPSGTQKSLVIGDLKPSTNYSFSVTASDLTGNAASNNAIVLSAKTSSNAATSCNGTASDASEGSFTTGYKYAFQTIGTDVKISFELLDTDKTGVVAFLFKQSPFGESQMTNVGGKLFSKTISGQTVGSTISYAVKFAFAGGLSVTKYFSYVVGETCALGIENRDTLKNSVYPNPVESNLFLRMTAVENRIILTDLLGQKLIDRAVISPYSLDMSSFKSGVYFLNIENTNGVEQLKIIKK